MAMTKPVYFYIKTSFPFRLLRPGVGDCVAVYTNPESRLDRGSVIPDREESPVFVSGGGDSEAAASCRRNLVDLTGLREIPERVRRMEVLRWYVFLVSFSRQKSDVEGQAKRHTSF